jgi:pyruvate/2-oxoglutarate dehydrogenase complex dihydrolipoamide acyltransferase (E2) component
MREGTLVAWLVPDGASVSEGQPLYTLELEKSTMDVESPASGVIRQVGVAGTTYKVGELIGEIAEQPTVATPAVAVGPGRLQRVGQVVADLEAAMRAWAHSAGAGPFFVFPQMKLTNARYRGQSVTPGVSMAVAFSGPVIVSLVQTLDTSPSAWRDMGPGGRFVSIEVPSWNDALASISPTEGEPLFMATLPYGGRICVHDTTAAIGSMTEWIEPHFVLGGMLTQIESAHRNWDRRALIATLR